MNQNTETLEKLLETLHEANEMVTQMLEKNVVPMVEKDLVKLKIARMYELSNKLSETPSQSTITYNNTNTNSVTAPKINKTPNESSNNEDKQPEDLIEFDEQNDKTDTKTRIKEKIIQEVKHKKPEKENTKSDLQAHIDEAGKKTSLHDQLTRQFHKNDLSSKLQSRPITDLHKAINLNHQFLFIKNIFNGNADLYKNTIDRLNSMNNFNDAFELLSNGLKLDMDNESMAELLNIVRRKYITDND